MFQNENAFDDIVTHWSAQYGVPVWAIKSTIGKESSFEPDAFLDDSSGGSRGLMQLEEATARDMGLRGTIGDDSTKTGGLYEPSISVQLGTKYLAQISKRYPDEGWDAIYSAYNVGHLARLTDGRFVDQTNVDEWSAIADHFNPGWRDAGATDAGVNPTRPRTG